MSITTSEEKTVSKETNEKKANLNRRFIEYLITRNRVVEIMIDGVSGKSQLWKGNASKRVVGWFNDPSKIIEMVSDLRRHEADYTSVFVTFNKPKKAACNGNSMNMLLPSHEVNDMFFKDKDIFSRTNIFIDVDPVVKSRPVSDEETSNCINVCKSIRADLRKLGLPDSVVLKSGNGAALFIPFDAKNTEESKSLLKSSYRYLKKFSNDKAEVDVSVSNASRYGRLPGTENRKSIDNEGNSFKKFVLFIFPKKCE